jgi:hypothetical protein
MEHAKGSNHMFKSLLRIQAPLLGALLMIMAFVMFSAGADAAAPLSASREDLVGPGFHMQSDVNLGPTGQIDVVTHTWTTSWGLGFTGGVYALLRDQNGTVIGATHLHTFGVDAKSIFWGRSSRYDYWTESVDPRVAAATTSIQIIQQHTPQNRISEIFAYVESIYNQAKQTCQNMGLCN